MSGLVVLTRDLMDGGRFRSATPEVTVVRDPGDAALAAADLIVVDLALGTDLAPLVALGPPVIAYGAHVDTEALDSAMAAGCVDAVPRSRIFRRAGELLD
ncbi:MAG: hypothetical protein DHS20C19_12140 [Acidimicrobiales bacterium]|nr:MAG: hypothetical protein DHS20C19_12140 [Acidimicrobiales bacterium]